MARNSNRELVVAGAEEVPAPAEAQPATGGTFERMPDGSLKEVAPPTTSGVRSMKQQDKERGDGTA